VIRLADRDVLRIGSIDMQLDSPRADNRPAAETVRLPAGAWPDAQEKAHYRLGEAARHQLPHIRLRTYAPAGRIRSLSDWPGQRSAGQRSPPGGPFDWRRQSWCSSISTRSTHCAQTADTCLWFCLSRAPSVYLVGTSEAHGWEGWQRCSIDEMCLTCFL